MFVRLGRRPHDLLTRQRSSFRPPTGNDVNEFQVCCVTIESPTSGCVEARARGNWMASMLLKSRFRLGVTGQLVLIACLLASRGDAYHLYYANFHSHTGYSDGARSSVPRDAYIYARDTAHIDIQATTDHGELLDQTEWDSTEAMAESATIPGRFLAIRGFEWTNNNVGHISVWFSRDYTGVGHTPTLGGFYTWLSQRDSLIGQFNHPGRTPNMDFDTFAYDPAGDSNMGACEMQNTSQARYYTVALDSGWHVGATAGQDNHDRSWGDSSQLTGIWADTLTRKAIYDALRAMRTFGSLDRKFALQFTANDSWMGSTIPYAETLGFRVVGSHSDPSHLIDSVRVVTNHGVVAASLVLGGTNTVDWHEVIASPPCSHRYYYVQVFLNNGSRVQSSAIWMTDPVDVGVNGIIRPVASFLMPSWKIPPLVRIKNFGSVSQGPFNVRFTMSPGSYTSTKTVLSLAAGDTCAVEFDSLTLDYGVFTAKCSTMLAGDLTSGNDARTAYFQGCTFIDFFDLTDGSIKPRPTTGRWTRGKPQSPWALPPMDDTVWGNRLSGYYGNSEGDTLTSPRYRASQNNPAIAFQHCYNTQPSVDGGNFAYSTDSATWILPTPVAGVGYGGTVSALGQPGWSGTSGWNQSVFTISVNQNANFLVRWRFASDGSNNSYYGWLIDEIAGINCAPTDGKGASGPGTFVDTVKIHPNLIRGTAQVNYTLVKDCSVTIKLYDASGRLAARVPTSGFKKGKNTARLDASGLARGVYFVKVKGETDTRTTKVIIE